MKSAVPNIDINPVYWREVVRLLREYVPEFDVWAFGSRVKWTAKSHSDLDLAIITSEPLSLSRFAELREVFDESVLPFRVDIVDWAATSESFRRIIERDKLVIQSGQTSHVLSTQFPVFPLEECLEALIDYRGKTPEKTSSGIPLVTAKVIKGGRIEPPTEFIAPDDYDLWMRRGLPNRGDVVMTTEAPLGEVAQLGDEKVALAQRVITLRGKPGFLDNTYLLYLLQTEEMQEQLRARATGTTVLGIKQSELRKISVRVPPFGLQSSIAGILKSLDDRITLLRETNATLEAIAQALFKSWFVDFDPVYAKQQGRVPEGMDEATAALFPDSFEESEQGLVPTGWEWSRLERIATVIMGLSPKGDSYNSDGVGVPLINGPVEFGDYFPVQTKWTDAASRLAEAGDLIFCVRGSTTGRRVVSDREYCIGRGVCAIRSKQASPGFIYQTVNFGLSRLLGKTTGSVFPSLSAPDIKSLQVLNPGEVLIHAYERATNSLLHRIQMNHRQIQTLATLRDTLLPRLISGQLRLPEASSVS